MGLKKIIARYNEIFEGDPWYGVSLLGALKEIPLEFWNKKPNGASHSIAEYVWHLIDWKVFVIEKLKGNESFVILMNSDQDWRENVHMRSEEELQTIFKELEDTQQTLCELIVLKNEDWFQEQVPGKTYTYEYMLEGILQHDIYHLGQINVINSQLKR